MTRDVYREQKALAASGLKLLDASFSGVACERPYRGASGRLLRENLVGMRPCATCAFDDDSLQRFKEDAAETSGKNALDEMFNLEIKPFAKKLGVKLALENLS